MKQRDRSFMSRTYQHFNRKMYIVGAMGLPPFGHELDGVSRARAVPAREAVTKRSGTQPSVQGHVQAGAAPRHPRPLGHPHPRFSPDTKVPSMNHSADRSIFHHETDFL